MKQRCGNPRATGFQNYGGKGIYVCERWLGRKTGFANFLADMGPKPSPAHTLERQDSNGPYSPENCRWATRAEQLLNTSRTHHIIDDDGVSHTTTELAERYGIRPELIGLRHRQGKPFAEIISTHHLAPGYVRFADAVATAAVKNRARTHCKNGHELTPENVSRRQDEPGTRICRLCNAAAQRRYRERKALSEPHQ